MLLAVETIQLNDTPHILSMAVDISQRKRAEEELRHLKPDKLVRRRREKFLRMGQFQE